MYNVPWQPYLRSTIFIKLIPLFSLAPSRLLATMYNIFAHKHHASWLPYPNLPKFYKLHLKLVSTAYLNPKRIYENNYFYSELLKCAYLAAPILLICGRDEIVKRFRAVRHVSSISLLSKFQYDSSRKRTKERMHL